MPYQNRISRLALLSRLSFAMSTALLAIPTFAATYQWNGTADTNWQNASNWAASPGMPTPNTTDASARLNVVNGAGQQLIYTAAEGTTTYGGSGIRGLVVGSATSGQMTLSGGVFATTSTGAGDVVGNNGGAGTLIVDGGTYNCGSSLTLNNNSNANSVLTINSGTATISNIQFKSGGASSSVINLNGGTLNGRTIGTAAGTANSFNFNGGTLRSTGALSFAVNTANVRNGGANIDTNGFSSTINQALLHSTIAGDNAVDGGLTKNGAGTLTLGGINTYTGDTTINQGTLTLSSSSELLFKLSDSDSSRVKGTGTVNFSGIFRIDSSALTVAAASWQLVDVGTLTANFNPTTFGLKLQDGTLFANTGGGIYSANDWNFDTATGQLTLSAVPEPAALGLIACGMMALLARRSRS